jgi:hypothetical protein
VGELQQPHNDVIQAIDGRLFLLTVAGRVVDCRNGRDIPNSVGKQNNGSAAANELRRVKKMSVGGTDNIS